jgi:ATP phosphoribosyltransferase
MSDGVLDAASPARTGLPSKAGDGKTGVLTSIADLIYAKQSTGKVKWVLAAPGFAFRSAKISRGRRWQPSSCARPARTRRHQVNVKVEFSWGATEVKPCSPTRSSGDRDRFVAAGEPAALLDVVMESTRS